MLKIEQDLFAGRISSREDVFIYSTKCKAHFCSQATDEATRLLSVKTNARALGPYVCSVLAT